MNDDDNDEKWVNIGIASEFYGVSTQTLRKWTNKNLIESRRTVTGRRIFRIGKPLQKQHKSKYIYCRVSSKKQVDDLQRQKESLLSQFPDHQIIEDIGSGINFKRRGLQGLIKRAIRGELSELVVASKDRLCRFGFDLLEFLFAQFNTKIVVLDFNNFKSQEQEFTEDILAILQVYACKWNGRRRYIVDKSKEVQIEIKKNPTRGPKALEQSQ